MAMQSSAAWSLALLGLGTTVPEEPVPAAVAYKASNLILAPGEVVRLSVEKAVGSCVIFLAFCVCTLLVQWVLFQSTHPWSGGVLSTLVCQGSDGHAWLVEAGEDVLLQSAWTWQEKQNQMFQVCLLEE